MKEWKGQLGNQEYTVRLLMLDELENVLRIQEFVLGKLENSDFLFPTSKEEFESSITNKLMIGVFVAHELIAFRALAIPVIDQHHLGYDIGLTKEQLHQVVYQDVTMVMPDYRGYGLQQKLSSLVMELLEPSSYTLVCATVAPFNIPSLKDKLQQGMVIGALKMKYEQKLRYVFYKKLHEERKESSNEVLIHMGEIEEQQKYITEGWIGTGIVEKEDGWYVTYEEKGNYL